MPGEGVPPLAAVLAGGVPGQGESVDGRTQHRRQQRQRGQEDEADGQHHAGGHRAEGRYGHQEHSREAHDYREAAEEDRLARTVHRHADCCRDVIGGVVKCIAEACDYEERVVNTERQGEHHCEVECPDREVRHLRDSVQDAHRRD
jgi:hypothetical protein